MDTDLFVAFVPDELAPALRAGQVVVMDNLAPHRHEAVRARIEGAGARLILLPPYSPDFNPIELANPDEDGAADAGPARRPGAVRGDWRDPAGDHTDRRPALHEPPGVHATATCGTL